MATFTISLDDPVTIYLDGPMADAFLKFREKRLEDNCLQIELDQTRNHMMNLLNNYLNIIDFRKQVLGFKKDLKQFQIKAMNVKSCVLRKNLLQQSDQMIANICRDLIHKEKQQVIAHSKLHNRDSAAQIFASTNDLIEAARCVHSCRHFGDSLFRQLFTSLQQPSAILPLEKWKILTSTNFNCSSQNVTWSPSQKNIDCLLVTHGLRAENYGDTPSPP